jgi:hypothetical protein
MSGTGAVLVRIVAIAVVSEASFRFVEQPFRTGRAQAALRRLRDHSVRVRWSAAAVGTAFTGAVVAMVVLAQAPALPEASIGTATAAARAPIQSVPPGSRAAAGQHTAAAATRTDPGRTTNRATASFPIVRTGPAGATTPATTLPAGPAEGGPVLAIGDSVMLAASADLTSEFGAAIDVDAGLGRHSAVGLARLADYRAAGRLRGLRALVVGLGSNGPFTAANLSQLRQLAAGVPLVVLVNVRVPDSWEAVSNQTIDSAAALPGFKVVDWYTASARPGLLWPDQVHPDPAGQQVYAALVAQAVTTAPSQASTHPGLVHIAVAGGQPAH